MNIIIPVLSNTLSYSLYSFILLKVNNSGYNNILYSKNYAEFPYPDEIHINGINQSSIEQQYNFDNPNNEVKLIWKNEINTTTAMFHSCSNITEIDLSNFNSSEIIYMSAMFYLCKSLTSVNFSNFDTSKVTNIGSMFYACISLISVDISNFNTSLIKDMGSMFDGCMSLISLKLPNFSSANPINMGSMFRNCSSLISLDLSTFNTSNVLYLDSIFERCSNMEYINLKNCIINSSAITNNSFYLTSGNLIICVEDKNWINLFSNKTKNFIYCFEDLNEIDVNENEYQCFKKEENINVYNNACEKCGLNYHEIYNNSNNKSEYINCYQSLEGYYLDEEDLMFKECYPSCKSCDKSGNETFHNCIKCKDNFIYLLNVSDYINCYDNCSYYYYYDNSLNKTFCLFDMKCPEAYNKLIIDKKECIDECYKDLIYKYEYNNSCYKECPENTINNSFYCEIITNLITQSSYIISDSILSTTNFQSDYNIYDTYDTYNTYNTYDTYYTSIISENIISNISEYIEEKKKELIDNYKDKDNKGDNNNKMSIDNKKNISMGLNKIDNKDKNNSTVNLGECEYKLKDSYNISYNDSLYLYTLEVKEQGMKIPKIEYEVYYPLDNDELKILNLTYCKDMKIIISNSVSLKDKNNLDKYNPNSKYYTDVCYKITSEVNTDLSLSDRKQNFIKENLTLCEEDCDLIDYDEKEEKVYCSCKIKIKIPFFEEIKIDKEKLLRKIKDVDTYANLKFLKCYKIVFNNKNIRTNIGFFIFIVLFAFFFVTLFLFIFKFFDLLQKEI